MTTQFRSIFCFVNILLFVFFLEQFSIMPSRIRHSHQVVTNGPTLVRTRKRWRSLGGLAFWVGLGCFSYPCPRCFLFSCLTTGALGAPQFPRLDVPRAYLDERQGFPLTEAGAIYTPNLLVFRCPDTVSSDRRITGLGLSKLLALHCLHCTSLCWENLSASALRTPFSNALDVDWQGSRAHPPWTTSLLSVAALDLRPERGNQGAVYGGDRQKYSRVGLLKHDSTCKQVHAREAVKDSHWISPDW